jgi:flagellar hook-associated protein 3 FlgL
MTSISGSSTSVFFDRSTQGMGALRAQAEKLQEQVGSGKKLARSSDDPVAAARLRALSRAETASNVDKTNADRAAADLGLADNALSSVADLVIRAKELATQAATGTITESQRAGIGKEIAEIHGQLVQLANLRDSGGNALFGGQVTGDAYVLGANGAATYVGAGRSDPVPLADGQTITPSVTGPEFLNFTANGSQTDLLTVVGALGAALQGGVADPAAAARTAQTALDKGLEAVTTAQTVVGARMAWIDVVADRRTAQTDMRATQQRDLGETDIAATIANLQQVMLVLDASQASFSKLASLTLFDQLR